MRNLVGALLALASAAPAGAAPTVDPALPAYTPQAVQVPKDARYRAPDGSIRIPDALKPYMGGLTKVEKAS